MVEFYKYHGAGNDFILIDNRNGIFDLENTGKIAKLCHRRFGIGADGILLLEASPGYDFKMIYANSDGSRGAMCGNGGRCIVHFAHYILKIIRDPKKVRFMAVDGEHEAEILEDGNVKLKMQDVDRVFERNGLPFLHSGTTPHHVKYVENIENFPIQEEVKKIRSKDEDKKGINLNCVEIKDGVLHVRTYERGVEDETLACGTGATSVAIASYHLGKTKNKRARIKMPGGELIIEFDPPAGGGGTYQNIWLTGPAALVFRGEIN